METATGMKLPVEPDTAGPPDFPGTGTFLASVRKAGEELQYLRDQAEPASALMTSGESAVLAADVEAISRTVDYLQLVCAGALETHRVAASFGADSRTAPAQTDEPPAWTNTWNQTEDSGPFSSAGKVRAEFRTTADYMRCRLRISRSEAQRRLKLAAVLLPSSTPGGHPLPPALPVLAEGTASGSISSAAAGVIANAVDGIRHRTDALTASTVEADLTTLAEHQDVDFVVRAARRWVLLVEQDSSEPTEDELRRFQGVFPGRRKNGLNHLNVYCTDDQHETLLTVMNAAAGPRIQDTSALDQDSNSPAAQRRDGSPPDPLTAARLNRSTRAQRLLEGLVDAAKAALATGGIPAAGGLRPQVLVTIDSASLLQSFDYGSVLKTMDGPEPLPNSPVQPGAFAFSGPVAAGTVRKLACDADLLPVVLSGEGRLLDIGRAQRLFPPHLRKALHARDGGCAFPGCTIPGPWTEAHHIRYWNHGGPTSADNGVLLCSHHHHVVHKENWRIEVVSGVPWFVPPAYVDPDRTPLKNTYFRAGVGARCLRQPSQTVQVT